MDQRVIQGNTRWSYHFSNSSVDIGRPQDNIATTQYPLLLHNQDVDKVLWSRQKNTDRSLHQNVHSLDVGFQAQILIVGDEVWLPALNLNALSKTWRERRLHLGEVENISSLSNRSGQLFRINPRVVICARRI